MSRVSPGVILLGFVAVLCGLLGAYVVRQSMQSQPAAAAQQPQRLVVPMASTDLKAGRKITMGDISVVQMTPEQAKKKGIQGAYMTNSRQIIGRILRTELARGATFDTTMFYPEGLGPSIEERLQPGYRAVTVPVEADDALLGFAAAGSWVDVLFRSTPDQNRGGDRFAAYPETTITLMENVQLLALGQDTVQGAKSSSGVDRFNREVPVTLAVTPEQAAQLRVVEGRGLLTLALRLAEDKTQAPTAAQTLDDVLGFPSTRETLDVYRGGRLSRVMFDINKDRPAAARRIGQLTSPAMTSSGQQPVDSNTSTN